MIKAFLLLFEPAKTWDKIAQAQRSTGRVLLTFFLPMIVLAGAAEGYGLVKWGKRVASEYQILRTISPAEAVVYEATQGLLYIVVAFAAAMMLKTLGETFHGRNSFRQAFTTIAYGLSPLFLARLLDAFPATNPWATWGVGIILSVTVLYQGLPRIMQPDPPHAFGLYLINSLLLILITGLARFITAWYLLGHFKPVEDLIKRIAGQLPF